VTTPVLVSLLLLSDHGQGHVRDYNEAVGRAARLAGWEHRAALVKNWEATALPPDWEVCIDCPDLEHFWTRNLGYGKIAGSLARYLRERIVPLERPAILFVENLSTSTLILLWLALRQVPRERLALWLLIRFSLRTRGPAGVAGRAVLGALRRLLPAGGLQLLTDSQPLAEALEAYTGQPFTVMPIPHIDVEAGGEITNGSKEQVVAWWPGAPRAEKGLATMQALAQHTGGGAERLTLVVAAGAALTAVVGGPEVRFLPAGVDRATYRRTLSEADLILLPYAVEAYRERTSGIFVEAVAAGKPVVVPAGTWMAGELARHDLRELIVDWAAADLPAQLIRLAGDAKVRAKLAVMRTAYLREHGVEAYAAALRAVYARGQTSPLAPPLKGDGAAEYSG